MEGGPNAKKTRSKYRRSSYTLHEKCLYFLVRILPAFMLNTAIYSINLHVQSECGKIYCIKSVRIRSFSRIRTEYGEIREYMDQKNSKYGHFQAVLLTIKNSEYRHFWRSNIINKILRSLLDSVLNICKLYVNVEDFFSFWTSSIILANFYKIIWENPWNKHDPYRKLILEIRQDLNKMMASEVYLWRWKENYDIIHFPVFTTFKVLCRFDFVRPQ